MVDLGVGIPWACCNVTARSPEDAGEFFAWGETREKDNFDDVEYRFYNEGPNHSRSYEDIGSCITGTRYDAAMKVFGDNWRMPTLYEMQQLVEKCTKTFIRMNGVPGVKFTGPSGRSIFLPFGGEYICKQHRGKFEYGSYWCADIFGNNNAPTAWQLSFSEQTTLSSSFTGCAASLSIAKGYCDGFGCNGSNSYCYYGQTIRPVCD